MPEHAEADKKRDSDLSKWGIVVLRYSNNDINHNFKEVADDILRMLELEASDLSLK